MVTSNSTNTAVDFPCSGVFYAPSVLNCVLSHAFESLHIWMTQKSPVLRAHSIRKEMSGEKRKNPKVRARCRAPTVTFTSVSLPLRLGTFCSTRREASVPAQDGVEPSCKEQCCPLRLISILPGLILSCFLSAIQRPLSLETEDGKLPLSFFELQLYNCGFVPFVLCITSRYFNQLSFPCLCVPLNSL